MSKQELYRYVTSILRGLRIPFVDPCNPDYEGDCLCSGGGSGPTILKGTNTIRTGSDGNLELNFGTTLPSNEYQVFITVITSDSQRYTHNVFQKSAGTFRVFFSVNEVATEEQLITFDWMIVQ